MQPSRIVKRVIRLKIYIDRSKAYTNLVMALLIGVGTLNTILSKKELQDFGLIEWMNANLPLTYAVAVVFGAVSLLFIGWLDTRVGARAAEMEDYSMQNPVSVRILNATEETLKIVKDERPHRTA